MFKTPPPTVLVYQTITGLNLTGTQTWRTSWTGNRGRRPTLPPGARLTSWWGSRRGCRAGRGSGAGVRERGIEVPELELYISLELEIGWNNVGLTHVQLTVQLCEYEHCTVMWIWTLYTYVIINTVQLCDYKHCTVMWIWTLYSYVIINTVQLCDYKHCTVMWL